METETAVWKRGREIFERTKSPNEVWGNSAAPQTHKFPPPGDSEGVTFTVIGAETRSHFIVMAREELKTERH